MPDELTSALIKNQEGTVTDQFTWTYDAAGNRLSEQHGSSTRTWAVNSFNPLTGQGTVVELKGTVDRASTVKINGVTATMNGLQWSAQVPVTQAQATLEAQEVTSADGGTPQKVWGTIQLPPSTTASYTYDANGNMLSDGERTFEGDTENRLVKVMGFWGEREFRYDGFDRRVLLQERDPAGALREQRRFAGDWYSIVEEREPDGAPVRRYWGVGEQQSAGDGAYTNFIHTRDRLGSICEILDQTGSVRAQYAYTDWGGGGRSTAIATPKLGLQDISSMSTAVLRCRCIGVIGSDLGRWISVDPIGEAGGWNRYRYVGNNPVRWVDPLGLYYAERWAAYGAVTGGSDSGLRPWQTQAVSI